MKLLPTLIAGALIAAAPSAALALSPYQCELQAQQYAESQYPEGGGAARGATSGVVLGGVFAGLSGGKPLRGALLGGAGGLVVGSALWQQAKHKAHDDFLANCLRTASTAAPVALPPTPFPSTTIANTLNVRSGAGTNFAVLGQISAGQVFQVLSCAPGWCGIDRNGDHGYVAANYLYPLYDD
jgi:uncharacterized protein YgiM (DUF1202 family)